MARKEPLRAAKQINLDWNELAAGLDRQGRRQAAALRVEVDARWHAFARSTLTRARGRLRPPPGSSASAPSASC